MKRYVIPTWIGIVSLLPLSSPASDIALADEFRRNGPAIREVLDPVQKSLQDHSAVFYDAASRNFFIYGTVMSADGLIFTKASELAEVENFTVRVGREHFRKPQIIAENLEWDLALVKIDASDLKPVNLDHKEELKRGTWVVSNGSTQRRTRRVRPGVISANTRKIDGPVQVVLGVQLKIEKEKISFSGITEDSGAAEAGLLANDVLESVDGVEIKNRDDLFGVLKTKRPGQEVDILVTRGETKYSCRVKLKARHKVYEQTVTRNDQMSGLISKRRDNFPRIIQHDTTTAKRNMGGPVVTLDGICVGMNIARPSRVANYAIPAEELQAVFLKMKKQAGLD